jgi:hypothetical protein
VVDSDFFVLVWGIVLTLVIVPVMVCYFFGEKMVLFMGFVVVETLET